ncbi:MAG: hypothetical protein ACLTTU_05800 [Bilophila wadsworthia]
MNTPLVEFVGAGPGAEDLILRSRVRWNRPTFGDAGSLVNPALAASRLRMQGQRRHEP